MCELMVRATAVRPFDECRAAGYLGGSSQLKVYVTTIRARPAPEPVVRFETAPGEQAQFDFAEIHFPWGKRFALMVVLGYSRLLYVESGGTYGAAPRPLADAGGQKNGGARRKHGALRPWPDDGLRLAGLRAPGQISDIATPSPFPDLPAALAADLRDRYVLERKLGRGGMATVYLAQDLEHGRQVALKVLLPELLHDPGSVERLRREAAIAMRLDHPNVCPILGVGETPERRIYLVMPYLAGEPLTDHEIRRGPLPVAEGIPLLLQICRGLEHAHGLQILHRDLKPENVMLLPDPGVAGGIRAVVLDFGLAKVLREEAELVKLTRTGLVLGTAEFMSPEQIRGKPLDGRSDLYALAVLAFEMFTGRLPFEGKTPQEMMLARFKSEPLRLRALQPELPAKLEAVIGRALAVDPADRFQSMGELGAAFGSVTGKTGVFRRLFGKA
jgi:hypothetical protein